MNNSSSFERALQDIEAPAADPMARRCARDTAMAEFRRVHPAGPLHPAARPRRLWVQMLAAASVAVIGVAIVWRMPAEQRVVATSPRAVDVAPSAASSAAAPVSTSASTEEAEPGTSAPGMADTTSATQRETGPSALPATEPAHRRVATAPSPQPTEAAPPSAGGADIDPIPAPDHQFALAAVATPIQQAQIELPTELNSVVVTGTRVTESSLQATAGSGQQFVDRTIANLRGLDPAFGSRTLTLVDGRRGASTTAVSDGLVSNLPAGVAATLRGFRFPSLPASRDQFVEFKSNPVKRTVEEPVSTFSLDVDTSSYSFVRRELLNGRLPSQDAVRVEELVNYFDYAWPAARSRNEPFGATVTVSDSPWAEGRKLVHVGIKGYQISARRQPDSNLVLLLDVSGSMNEPDKLPLARRSLRLLLDALKPTDTVSIVTYAGRAGEALGPTPVRERDKIEAALDQLSPGGSTAGAQGIRLAYDLAQRSFRRDGVNRILLATDGDFNVGVSDPGELTRLVEQERKRGVYLSVLGFGQGNYRDDIAQALAQNGNGVAAYIDSLTEARKVLVREATSSLFPIAADAKIQVEFNPDAVAEYRLIGYETRALQREDFNNDQVDAAEVGAGRAVTAIYEITPVGSGAQLIDDLRYGDATTGRAQGSRRRAEELGYLKIRYKLPGESQSKLIERPIRVNTGVPRSLQQEVDFSTAVAAFGQLLRSGAYTGSFAYDDVLRLARKSTGEDPHGDRAEFITLVEEARALGRRDNAQGVF